MEQAKARQLAIILHEKDNVATVIQDLFQGTVIRFEDSGLSFILSEDIQFGHKFSLKDMNAGGNHLQIWGCRWHTNAICGNGSPCPPT